MSDWPASGAWRAGDPPGRRQFVTRSTTAARARDGRAARRRSPSRTRRGGRSRPTRRTRCSCCTRSPATVTRPAARSPGHGDVGWWDGAIGPGAAIDTDRFFVVCPNVLGGCQGTTGPVVGDPATAGRTARGSRRSRSATRSRSRRARRRARDRAVGRGGRRLDGRQRVLEWAVTYPERVAARGGHRVRRGGDRRADRAVLRSRSARSEPTRTSAAATTTTPSPATARGAACRSRAASGRSATAPSSSSRTLQPRPPERRAPVRGRAVHDRVVPRVPRREARPPLRRQHATSCCREAMNHHDVGPWPRRGRAPRSAASPAEVTIAGISSDRLYPLRLQEELAELIPSASAITWWTRSPGTTGSSSKHERSARSSPRARGARGVIG